MHAEFQPVTPLPRAGAVADDHLSPLNPGGSLEYRYLLGVLALGLALRTAVYLRGYNLYIDEASLASSILSRDWIGLLTPPLDYGQLAPPGFLLLEKAISLLLGSSELALRALPFAASLVTLPLLLVLARQMLDGRATLIVVAMAAVSYGLIFYGTQMKQYATDTAISTGLLLWALRLERRNWPYRGVVAYGALGAVLVWISLPALFVLAGVTIAAGWLRRDPHAWPSLRRVAVMPCLWIPSGALAAWIGLQYVHQPAYTDDFWRTGYFPWPITGLFDLTWPVRALLRPLVTLGLIPGFPKWTTPGDILILELTFLAGPPLLLALVMGIVRAWRSTDRAWLYLAAPVAMTFLAAVLHFYPFGADQLATGRPILFLAPAYLLAIAHGAQPLWDRFHKWRRPAALAVALSPLVMLVAWLPSKHREELEPVLRQVAGQWQPGDRLYVYYGALPAFRYYAPRTGTDTLPVVEGVCAPLYPPAYVRDLERVRPSSGLWVIFSHVNHVHGWGEDEFLLAHLERIGSRTASIEKTGASAHRFTLTPAGVPPRGGPVPYQLPDPLPYPIHTYDCAAGFGPRLLQTSPPLAPQR